MTAPPSPAPVALDEVLSPAWLTGVLSAQSPGVEVGAVEVTETLKTVATKVRFRVDWKVPPTNGLPDAFCVKGYFDAEPAARARQGEVETNFYRVLAPKLAVRTPPAVHTGIDPHTGHGIVIMHDLVAAGCTFLTALSPYTPDQAAATLDQLARLHAHDATADASLAAEWLAPRTATLTEYVSEERLQELLDDPRGATLPRAITRAGRVRAALRAVVARYAEHPQCLIHGDSHAGNLFVTADGEPGVIDWQLVQHGYWALDVAYHIGSVLSIADRERSERDLLKHYLDRVRAHGGEPVDAEQAWDDYRVAMAYGYFLWAITQRVQPAIIVEFVTRLGTAVAAHESFETLGV